MTGWMPAKITSSGVISDPPPMPVMPTRIPTPSPNTTISGSMRSGALSGRRRGHVQAALGLVLAGPTTLAALARRRAGHAADRGVAAVVQGVVGEVVGDDVIPHVAVRPVDQRVDLPQAALVALH